VTAADDVEREGAAAVAAVEEPIFLLLMQRIVGGIEVDRDLCRRLRPPTGAKVISVERQSVAIGEILCLSSSLCRRRLSQLGAQMHRLSARYAGLAARS